MRLGRIFLCFCLFLALFLLPARAEGAENQSVYELNADGESYCVASLQENIRGRVVIPEVYNGKPVTVISNGAFYDCPELETVVLPEGLREIGPNAFRNCVALEAAQLPEQLQTIQNILG